MGKLISDNDDDESCKLQLGEMRINALCALALGVSRACDVSTFPAAVLDDDFFKRYHSHEVDSCGVLFEHDFDADDDDDEDILPLTLLENGDLKNTGEDKRRDLLALPSAVAPNFADFFDLLAGNMAFVVAVVAFADVVLCKH